MLLSFRSHRYPAIKPYISGLLKARNNIYVHSLTRLSLQVLTMGFGLMQLPRELRDHIYQFALVSCQEISLLNFAEDHRYFLPQQQLGISPNILRACRQIYCEALSILYASNTFYVKIDLHLHQALRRIQMREALSWLPILDECDPPAPEVHCIHNRPSYSHPQVNLIRQLIIQLDHVIPHRPHWYDEEMSISRALTDVCATFVEDASLRLLVVRSKGVVRHESWLPAAAGDTRFAQSLEALMWQYHEWHFERAALAAARAGCFLFLDGDATNDRISQDGPAIFFDSIRAVSTRLRGPQKDGILFSRTRPRRCLTGL